MNILRNSIRAAILSFIVFIPFITAYADSPTEIFIGTSGNVTLSIPENSTNGTVGNLLTDADPADLQFYETDPDGSSAGNFRFNIGINGEIELVRDDLIFAGSSYTFRVEVQESFGVTIFQNITINITDVNDPPTFNAFTSFLRYEEQGTPTQIFYSEFDTPISDPDGTDPLSTLTITEDSCLANDGSNCSGVFSYTVENIPDGFGGFSERLTVNGPEFDFEDPTPISSYDITLRAEDDEGASNTGTFTITNANLGEVEDIIDGTTTADGTYGIGDTIQIDVDLSDANTLYYNNEPRDPLTFNPLPAETPVIELNLDSGVVEAEVSNLPADTFSGGTLEFSTGDDLNGLGSYSGVPITFLRFAYTIVEGDETADLSYNGVDAIDLKTATIEDTEFGNDFLGTYYFEDGPGRPIFPSQLPTPGTTGSLSLLKDIVIDGIRPSFDGATGSAVLTNHMTGDTINFSLDLDETITYSGTGDATVDIDVGGTIFTVDIDPVFAGTSPATTTSLPFSFIVPVGVSDNDGIDIVENSFDDFLESYVDNASNDMTDFSHPRINLPNDLVNSAGPATAPTDIDLSNTAIDENSAVGTVIGTLTTTDPTPADNFTYTLVAGAGDTDNASFNIDTDELRNNEIFDFETKNSYSIRVRTTDAGLEFYEEQITITVNDLAEGSSGGSGGGSGSSGGSSGCIFNCSDDEPTEDTTPEETMPEEEPVEEPTPEESPEEEVVIETTEPEPETPAEPFVPSPPSEEPTPVEEPTEDTTPEEPSEEDFDEDESEEETTSEEPEEETTPEEEPAEDTTPEIKLNGSLTTGNGNTNKVANNYNTLSCEDYLSGNFESDEAYALNCNPLEELEEEEFSSPTVILNLNSNTQNSFGNDSIVITGKTFNTNSKEVDVFVISDGTNLPIGRAEVDEKGQFIILNNQTLPRDTNLTFYALTVEDEVRSPDYDGLINNKLNLNKVDLISFAGKEENRLWKSNDENIDYRTFVSISDIKENGLNARVKSDFKKYHKAYWQSILFGSAALTGTNSNETVLEAPQDLIDSLTPFSTHRVTMLVDDNLSGSKSIPLVVEYYVVPKYFGTSILIVILLAAIIAAYVYKRNKDSELENNKLM